MDHSGPKIIPLRNGGRGKDQKKINQNGRTVGGLPMREFSSNTDESKNWPTTRRCFVPRKKGTSFRLLRKQEKDNNLHGEPKSQSDQLLPLSVNDNAFVVDMSKVIIITRHDQST